MSTPPPPVVAELLQHCPFLAVPLREEAHLDDEDMALATVVLGGVAGLLIQDRLPGGQADAVFAWLNILAERGTDDEVLGTGAIELFNDTAAAQQLARFKFTGRALAMLEQYRVSWGQPDYGDVR